MRRVVVTGGFGFLGSHLVERLVRQGDEVTVYDLAPPPPDLDCDLSAIRHVRGDVRDATALSRAISSTVDTVYHLAAVVGVDRYLDRPLDVIDVNVWGTRAVLDATVAAGARIVLASTSEVYGVNPRVPWSEESDRVLGTTGTDRWSYSTSKALAEHLTWAYARQHGLRASIVRYFNVYGPRQRPAYVISRTIHRLLHGLPPLVYDSGAQTRCFTYVEDAVDATVRAGTMAAALGECFNIGSDWETTVAQAVRIASQLAGLRVPPTTVDTGRSFGAAYQDIIRRVPDTTKARTRLGWRCATTLEEGLRRTIEWAQRSPWLAAEAPDRAGERT